jgi:hypothetical protein
MEMNEEEEEEEEESIRLLRCASTPTDGVSLSLYFSVEVDALFVCGRGCGGRGAALRRAVFGRAQQAPTANSGNMRPPPIIYNGSNK